MITVCNFQSLLKSGSLFDSLGFTHDKVVLRKEDNGAIALTHSHKRQLLFQMTLAQFLLVSTTNLLY